MAYSDLPTKRDVVGERMAEMYRRAREPELTVPAHLKGKLYSAHDLLESALEESHKGLVLRKWGAV